MRRRRSAFVTFVGAATAFFAATVGLTQIDIKRVIAYSTCSQLGYMFFAAGVGAYRRGDVPPVHPRLLQGAAVPRRRLGDPRHAPRAGHAQDGRHLAPDPVHLRGDVDRHAGAGVGFPGFAGFFSKDAILEAAWASHNGFAHYAFWLGVIAALLTASTRGG